MRKPAGLVNYGSWGNCMRSRLRVFMLAAHATQRCGG